MLLENQKSDVYLDIHRDGLCFCFLPQGGDIITLHAEKMEKLLDKYQQNKIRRNKITKQNHRV